MAPGNVDQTIPFVRSYDPNNWIKNPGTSSMIFQPDIEGHYFITIAGVFHLSQLNNNLQIQALNGEQLFLTFAPGNTTTEGSKLIYFNGTTDAVRFTAFTLSPSFLRSNPSTFFNAQLITYGLGVGSKETMFIIKCDQTFD
jgi:hypothetical protein